MKRLYFISLLSVIVSIILSNQIFAQSEIQKTTLEEYGGNNDWEKGGLELTLSQDDNYIYVKGSAWHIAVADISGNGEKELVYATYDGFVRCQDLNNGQLLWEVNLHSFPFDLHLDDLNRDGRQEILCAVASGKLFVISPEGIIRWTFESELPLYNVGTGQIVPGGEKEVVCGGIDRHVYLLDHTGKLIAKTEKVGRLVHPLKVVDLNNNGKDDIIAIDHRHDMKVFEWNGTRMDTLFTRTLTVPEKYRNWENPGSKFNVFSLTTGDLDNDGITELVGGDSYANKQAVMAMTSAGKQLWISEKQPFFTHIGETQTEFYSMAMVGIAELDEKSPGKEVISVAGGMIRMLSSNGTIIKEVNAGIGFTDLFIEGKILYLGSSPNGDEMVYRVDMAGDWVAQVAALSRFGKMQEIENNLDTIRSLVDNYLPKKDVDSKLYDVYLWSFRIRAFNEESYQEYISLEKWFAGQFPYQNIRPVVITGAMEPTPPLNEKGEPWNPWRWNIDVIRGTQTVEEIIDRARWIEEHKIPTLFSIGHSCMPFITLETAEKILQAAPEYCVGFITSEDENIDLLPRYIEHFFAPLADLCVKYGYKKCITRNKNLWWMSVPSIRSVYDNLFKGERKKVVVAATEDSNSRCPELNLMGRGGLYLAGLIENNDVSIHADLFSFNRYFQWEYPKTGHPYLRLLVAHSTLGMSQVSSRIAEIRSEGGNHDFSLIGRESTEIFFHMLGKGAVFSPEPSQIRGYSSIGIAVHTPTDKWFNDAHNGHSPEKWLGGDPELDSAIIPNNGCLWGMTETPGFALQKVLFHKTRQFGYQIPATPYGLVAFVPAQADLERVPGIKEWWHTDGIYLWEAGGPKLTGTEAAKALKISFEKASDDLLFKTKGEDVFLQVLQTDPNTFRLYLIDPGWLDPSDCHIKVISQRYDHITVKDLLSRESIACRDNEFDLVVPTGGIRILEIHCPHQ